MILRHKTNVGGYAGGHQYYGTQQTMAFVTTVSVTSSDRVLGWPILVFDRATRVMQTARVGWPIPVVDRATRVMQTARVGEVFQFSRAANVI